MFDFVPYPDGSFSWHHLWYLAYIFCYSVLGLPLLLWLRRRTGLTGRLAALFANPWALVAVPVLWHVSGSVLLAEDFPTTHNLVKDWNEHFHDFTLFVTGFVLCTQTRFWETLRKYRRLALGIWVTLTIALYAFYWTVDRDMNAMQWLIYDVIKTTNAWCILLSIFGYAYTYLQFTNPFLKYANEAVYPFYILHQTVIVCLAFPLINASVHWFVKFIYLSIATFGICLGLYHLLIRRSNMLRVLFGMKALERRKVGGQAVSTSSVS
ncbi:acyltransferase family protein [Dyadobacter sp. 676]|uniref:Acyltransferase family protein n=1 Tax=Dyadobacter sp. 676 TaxID=3088362 RepID=A0AAU8FRD0_9BACT